MSTFLIYILKVALLTAAFVLLYHLLARRDTFYSVGRAVMVASLVISYILPLCVITLHKPVNESPSTVISNITVSPKVTNNSANDMPVGMEAVSGHAEISDLPSANNPDLLLMIAITVYLAGVALLLVLRSISIYKVIQIVRNSHVFKKDKDYTILISSHDVQSFSWMRYIIVPESIGNRLMTDNTESGSWEDAVICHERAHVVNHHSLELLFTDMMSVFQWFNPAVWLLRHDLCNIHEYQADSAVLNAGYEKSKYQESLLNIACGYNALLSVNGIGISNLRSRMLMMNCQASGKKALLKYMYLPLLIVASMLLTSNKVYDRHEAPYVLSDSRQNQSIRRLYEYPDTEYYYQGLRFNIANGVAVLDGYDWAAMNNGPERYDMDLELTVPSTIPFDGKEYTVRVIAPTALNGTRYTRIVLPETITEIGADAFASCRMLESITIPSSVCVLQSRAFTRCDNLKSVYIENGLKELPEGLFLNCRNLESVHLPSTLKTIGDGAFSDCRHLTEINLPKKLERIGDEAFFRCIRLSSVIIPKKVSYIGNGAFYDCRSLENVDPSKLKAEIGDKAFYMSEN
ncbi:MAG: leucine-rich repeat protein [Bacteroidaceae bacterium]|nr:leucine-rich repeat protein [Bacteroidaceae bacterium]